MLTGGSYAGYRPNGFPAEHKDHHNNPSRAGFAHCFYALLVFVLDFQHDRTWVENGFGLSRLDTMPSKMRNVAVVPSEFLLIRHSQSVTCSVDTISV
jgi:hypothetical protein